MKGNKGAIHSVKGQAGRSALLKLSVGNSGCCMWKPAFPHCYLGVAAEVINKIILNIFFNLLAFEN